MWGARFTTFLTPKTPPFSVAIGLPHLPLGTWGITPLLSPTIQIKTEKHYKMFDNTKQNYYFCSCTQH
ncbi:hypothetical protein [uncultured Prevotella sp.]|uniref:hypothetical protein n=1 Tax=uncultured Prevotella sp. TaxID=159272 RepID=UPI0027D9B343|nr:hypothetical protein [uncultured Prevotella sp.]